MFVYSAGDGEALREGDGERDAEGEREVLGEILLDKELEELLDGEIEADELRDFDVEALLDAEAELDSLELALDEVLALGERDCDAEGDNDLLADDDGD